MGVAELGPLLDERSVYVPIALTEPQGSERDAVTASPRPDNIAVPLAPPPPGATPYGGPATR
jgi:hypothetical protein